MNCLYYGDNLDVLRHIDEESVDLIHLDPPFNDDQNYNGQDDTRSAAKIKAFADTWRWDQESAKAFAEIVQAGGKLSGVMQDFREVLGENDMLAYLSMMAPRLVELRKVLKPHGSMHVHCDPTASHYLKLLMDAVFGPRQFRNEVVWHYSESHHDILLFYVKDAKAFNGYAVPWETKAEYAKITFITAGSDDPIEQRFRFLSWITKPVLRTIG